MTNEINLFNNALWKLGPHGKSPEQLDSHLMIYNQMSYNQERIKAQIAQKIKFYSHSYNWHCHCFSCMAMIKYLETYIFQVKNSGMPVDPKVMLEQVPIYMRYMLINVKGMTEDDRETYSTENFIEFIHKK